MIRWNVAEIDCNEVNNCDESADCIYDRDSSRYRCECIEGYSGDGYRCTRGRQLGATRQVPGPARARAGPLLILPAVATSRYGYFPLWLLPGMAYVPLWLLPVVPTSHYGYFPS